MTRYKIAQFALGLFLLFALLLPLGVWQQGRRSIYGSIESVTPFAVAVVFGAGLTPTNTPSDALMDRLTVAAELYDRERVTRILVSGDNRTHDYSEPTVMKQTLMETFGVPEDRIFTDYAGRRTYDTCRRAHELWGIDKAILVTQGYHLPRAIWTCRTLGIESDGISATLQPYTKEIPFKIREIGAIYKAFIDLYLIEPHSIGGTFIEDLDP